jgi:PadR family transcriptional regulator, regulatory protein PadR
MADILRDLFLGFVRVHVLYHASQEPAYGTWLIEELAEHGYKLSPGTLYPILHGLEEEKLLSSYEEVINGKVRKYYAITAAGSQISSGTAATPTTPVPLGADYHKARFRLIHRPL